MTNAEAIETLRANYPDICYGQLREAVDMAIEALKEKADLQPDCISRQTLQKELALYPIDDVTSEDEAGYNRAINDIQKMVLHLPSAQPEIVYCKDCICGHGEVWLSGNGSADFYGYCGRTQLRVLPYDYCSYAERREE